MEKKLRFNAKELGEILGIHAEGFRVYVWEDKNVLWAERLLQLTQRLNQQSELKASRSVRKGEMTPLDRLLFWFVIKNIIPWARVATFQIQWIYISQIF